MPATVSDVAARAARLRELHKGPGPLLVPNAWDRTSAQVLESVGFATIATTSAGVAWANGYRDGEQMPFDELFVALSAIIGAVRVPVSVDLEGGYLEQSGGVEQTVDALISAGAAGINLDDGVYDPAEGVIDTDTLAKRLTLARRSSTATLGVPLFLIGRTELFWRQIGASPERLDQTIERLNAYLRAGADCAFVPGLLDATALRSLVAALEGPLNIMVVPQSITLAEVRELGIARATLGAALFLAAAGALEALAHDLLDDRLDRLEAPVPSAQTLNAITAGQL